MLARVTALLAATAALPALAQDCRFQDIGHLGGNNTSLRGISDDGSTFVGVATTAQGVNHAFRWTVSGGMVDLRPTTTSSLAWAVNSDGSVVVGWMTLPNGERRAFRWTAQAGPENLGTLGGDYSEARAVSDDGRVVIGYARNAARQMRYFRWTAETGIVDTGLPPAGYLTLLADTDASGTFVIGDRGDGAENVRAFRYDAVHGPVDLGTLQSSGSSANAASADGDTIVGFSGGMPFVWTPQAGISPLATSDGGYASCITPDGRWVGGNMWVTDDPRVHMARWDLLTGASQDLGAHSANANGQVVGIGAGGRVLGVGITVNSLSHGYRWTNPADFNLDGFTDFFDVFDYGNAFDAGDPATDTNGDGFLDFFDYLDFVAAFESGC